MNIKNSIHFLREGVWSIPSKTLSPARSFFLKQLRIIILALRGFDEDKCGLQASALTFYCLMSIVPVVAMAFGVAKGFGFEETLKQQIYEKFQDQSVIITKIVAFSESMLEKTQGGLVAGIGVAVLFFLVIKLLSNIERSFNNIWGIRAGRSLARKLTDYLAVMLICPLLFIMSSSLTVFLTTEANELTGRIAFLQTFSPLIAITLKPLPYLFTSVLFTFNYIFMPNTKVRFKSALFGGIVAGIIYQVAQWAYIKFQIGAVNYGAIYGGFAALPLFLLWLQMSWVIVLLGAEISSACQTVDTYEFEPDCLKVSARFKQILALRIVQLCVHHFTEGKEPWRAALISHELEIPIRLVREVIFELVQSGILLETHTPDDEPAYCPARTVENLRVSDVLFALEKLGQDTIRMSEEAGFQGFKKSLAKLEKVVKNAPANLLIKDV